MKETQFRTFFANFVIVAVLIVTMSVAFVAGLPSETGTQPAYNNAIYSGNTEGNSVCLMFNVYEHTQNVVKIADIFDEYGFKTTFFVGGSWANRNGDALIKIAARGFEIGNHGYLHRDHAKLNLKQNLDEIRLTEKILEMTLGDLQASTQASSPTDLTDAGAYTPVKLFAPPSGSLGKAMFEACEQLDYKVIMWTRDTIDWRDHDADLIFERAVRDIKAGDLILMHPTDCSVEALPAILEYIKASGLAASTVSATLSI